MIASLLPDLAQATAASAHPIPVTWYLTLSLVLFLVGVLTIVSRRNLIYVLMGVELILNAASLNFVAFAAYRGPQALLEGTIVGTFVVVLAASEAAIALAIVLNVFGAFGSVRPEDPNLMRE
ncbi:MAG: NADH-quinone oxidoreductase subunit NuoK [Planctomycetota bacterium]